MLTFDVNLKQFYFYKKIRMLNCNVYGYNKNNIKNNTTLKSLTAK